MDDEESRVQRSGYIDAIRHPDFIRAIKSGGTGRIALTYIEWSTNLYQKVVVPWQLIDNAEAADAFVAALEVQPPVVGRDTSISAAITFGSTLLAANDYDGRRRVIDISGDGPNNYGSPVAAARDAAVGEGIVINGLPILIRSPPIVADIARYYFDCVIGGPGAFVLPVHKAEEFAEAIRRKLILEVATRPSPRIIPAAAEEPADCLIGGKTRGRFTDQQYPGLDK